MKIYKELLGALKLIEIVKEALPVNSEADKLADEYFASHQKPIIRRALTRKRQIK